MNGHGPCQITTGLSINSALLLKEKCLEYSWYIREKFYCFDKKRITLTLLLIEIEFTQKFEKLFAGKNAKIQK